jgi:predicted metal-dependent hydrolase
MSFLFPERALLPDTILIGNQTIPLDVRPHPRARRLVMRLDPVRRAVKISVPKRTRTQRVLQFIEDHYQWLSDKIEAMPKEVVVQNGADIPFLGKTHRLQASAKLRGLVETGYCDDHDMPCLIVPGDPASMKRRVRDFLRGEARRRLETYVEAHTDTLGLGYKCIQLKDTRSRWGSCTSNGTLSFSWRIVMAPEHVIHYLSAHEVAHLVEMNHSPAFWSVVERLDPTWKKSRHWLRQHGASLHAVQV